MISDADARESVLIDTYATRGGATANLHRAVDGTVISDCTACGEYAWPLRPTRDQAWEHARTCTRPARRSAA
ncbi:hypothetical protein OG949_41220 (plasmid) [Streptomyces scopuliridis]|uniref:hypothetical protein n=1 Tax=Streptomyces scopuliridis TaxID=452529 RepID=UPI002DDAACAA|nr:hypothetical protein [Streptomyces scopuliridis]WSB39164.1 hypothetical protein OG949_41220 [Streptomyces scopuliridis]